ncbi:MAG: Rieske (2Fe-2S) protein [Cyanobacteriota bacterium]
MSSRRSVLQLLSFLTGTASGLLPALLRSGHSVTFAESEATFVEIAELEDLKEDLWVADGPEGKPIMLVKLDQEEVIALSAVCTHTGCTDRWSLEGDKILCRCHGSQFALDGEVLRGPASRPLETYETKIEDGVILIAKA